MAIEEKNTKKSTLAIWQDFHEEMNPTMKAYLISVVAKLNYKGSEFPTDFDELKKIIQVIVRDFGHECEPIAQLKIKLLNESELSHAEVKNFFMREFFSYTTNKTSLRSIPSSSFAKTGDFGSRDSAGRISTGTNDLKVSDRKSDVREIVNKSDSVKFSVLERVKKALRGGK